MRYYVNNEHNNNNRKKKKKNEIKHRNMSNDIKKAELINAKTLQLHYNKTQNKMTVNIHYIANEGKP